MVESCPIAEWSIVRMPNPWFAWLNSNSTSCSNNSTRFEDWLICVSKSISIDVLQINFQIPNYYLNTSESLLFRCFHYSDVRYSDPHCTGQYWYRNGSKLFCCWILLGFQAMIWISDWNLDSCGSIIWILDHLVWLLEGQTNHVFIRRNGHKNVQISDESCFWASNIQIPTI